MTNNCFKKALISEKVELSTSWPCLNETSNVKKPNKKYYKGCISNQVLTAETSGASPVESSSGEDGPLPKKMYPDKASFPKKSFLKEEEFPELSSVFLNKTHPCTEKKNFCNKSLNQTITDNNEKHNCKCPFKHPKFRKDVITLPLLSFVKGPHLKNKTVIKRVKPDKALCGNKLDKDQPVRMKGKVRLHKKKYESKLKKEIILSKTVKKKKIVYNQNILKVKCLLPSVINSSNDLSAIKLESLFSSLKIEDCSQDTENQESKPCKTDTKHRWLTPEISKKILHSQAFKEYCTNFVSSALLMSVEALIIGLRNFQDRLHAKEPIKAFAKRRYICGFKESKKFLLADKVKLIIIATNLQLDPDLPSGRVLLEIKSLTEKNEVPLVFAGRGNQIGYWTLKRRRISIVSILNFDGAEELFKRVIINWKECKKAYSSALEQIEQLYVPGSEGYLEDDPKNIEEKIREKILSKLSLPEEHFKTEDKKLK